MSTYRARDVTKWRMEEQDDGTYTIYRGRKRMKTGRGYVDAVRFIRGEVGDAPTPIKVLVVETDGYETDITRRFSERRL